MSRVTYPGVYREEVRSQQRVAQAASTANLALVSSFERGPVDEPVLVTDIDEAFRIFGDYWPKSLGPTTLASYFANGGQNAYIVRAVADDASKAEACFDLQHEENVATATGGGSSETVDETLTNVPVEPGSVTIEFTDDSALSVTGHSVTATPSGNTVTFTLPDTPLEPSSITINWTDSGTASATASDDGSGVITGGDVNSGSVDYETGEITFEATNGFDSPPGITVDYSFFSAVQEATTVDGLAGGDVYNGKFSEMPPLTDANVAFTDWTWTDATGTPRSAYLDDTNTIQGDASGSYDPVENVWTLEITTNGPGAGEDITLTWWYLVPNRTATDDGSGGFNLGTALDNATVTPAIDYETGKIDFETVVINGSSAPIDVIYDEEIHCSGLRNPGAYGNDFQITFSGNENYIDADTGDFSRVNVIIEEANDRGAFDVTGTFEAVVLDDLSSGDHISQILNDVFSGSSIIEMLPEYDAVTPPELQGQHLTVKVGEFGTGGVGANNPGEINSFLSVDQSRGVVPGTVEITYGDWTITDDGLGNLTGDLDSTATATVDYETGLATFTPNENAADNTAIEAEYSLLSQYEEATVAYSGGSDGADITRDDVTAIGLAAEDSGMYALDAVDEILIVTLPDFAGDQQAEQAAIAYVEDRDDSMVVVTPPKDSSVTQAVQYRQNVLASQSDRAAMYYPHILIEDPVTGNTIAHPPHGHVAGVWARTDANRNVGKAPAGTVDGALSFIIDFNKILTKAEVGRLTGVNVNSLWQPPRQVRAVWGARTLEIGGEYRYINKRRTIDFTSVTVARSLWWAVFENNGPILWARVSSQIRSTLRRFFLEGIYAGTSEDEAFFVKVNASNNPPEVVAAGQLIVDYGVATNTPAEFIRLRHRQITL